MAEKNLIEGVEQLEAIFRGAVKRPEERRVGTEHEKFIFRKDGSSVVHYHGDDGILAVLTALRNRYGYDPIMDGDNLVGLRYGAASLTLEPGGQFELSGAPFVSLLDTASELDEHLAQMRVVCDELGLVCVGAGLNGLQSLDDVDWMPKSRYAIMREYMTRVGSLGHWMMKMTCTVQANLDFTSEEDAAQILSTALWLSPVVSAMFARSPIQQGRPSGFMSTRCHIWTDTDPDRTGFPEFIVRGDFGFRDYVEYTLDVPMYFIIRDGGYVDMSGHSFRDFMRAGHQGYKATLEDYEDHIGTLFPEARMKGYIEVRGADVGPRDYVLALPAFWKGILYDSGARASARALVGEMSAAHRRQLFTNAIRWGLKGPVPGRDSLIAELASALVGYAADGLPEDERHLLEPLARDAASGEGPAHRSLARWHDLGGDTRQWILQHTYW